MKHRFSYHHIFLALLATLLLAGLFYLPYLAVRTRTMESFRSQQVLFARQAGSGMQSFFTTYGKALDYLVAQPSIQTLDESGKVLLADFHSLHPSDIAGIQRIDAAGSVLFSLPAESSPGQETASGYCGPEQQQAPFVTGLLRPANAEAALFFTVAVERGQGFGGCLSFSLPYARIAGRFLEQIPLHPESYVLLLNGEGDILYGPDTALIGRSAAHLDGDEENLRKLREQLPGGEPGLLTLSGDLLHGADQPGKKTYAVSFPVEIPGGSNWSIVLVTPAKEVLGAMAEFRSQWFAVTAIALLAVCLLSFFLSGVVTKRREERRLRAAEEQVAGLLDLAPMGVFLLGEGETVVYANREAVSMVTGQTEGTVTGRCFVDFLQPECRQKVTAQIREPAPGKAVRFDSVQLLSFSGKRRDIVITATPYHMGEQHQCIIIVRDVSEERRAEAWQRRLAAAIDQVKEAVLIADAQGKMEYVNAAMGEMTGFRREECSGQSVDLLWAKEQDAHFNQKIEDVVRVGEVWRGRIVNQRKDGSLFVAAATVSPVRNDSGATTHFVAVQRDITHEVEIESRMRQAQKMEAIGTLAGGIAHDFNNILGGIIGFTDMALLQCTPETEMYNNLSHIRQGGKRAADLVQQILTFSRQSAEEKVAVPVAPLIKESLKLLRATLPATIDIIQELSVLDVLVMAAPVQIQQIVMNLCANAFYSMREKGGRLTVSLERVSAAEDGQIPEESGCDWASLVVADTGPGMEGEILQRIFTPFFTTKEPGEGTGMGLSVVHGIVQELGGRISVQSQPGEGSIFTVLLPLADQGLHRPLLSGEKPLSTGTEHILVVDDEKEIRETYRMMLSHLGYTITTTGQPLEVTGLIGRSQPPIDLVITDQTMPKMTGVDLTGEVLRLHPYLPIILCTGYSDRLNFDIARAAGACDLLMKPVDLQGLSTAVRAALDMHR
jgi:PAS domain S-box-containing protein